MLETDIHGSILKQINEKHGNEMEQFIKNVITLLTAMLSTDIMSKCTIINWDEGVTLDWTWYALHISNNDPIEFAVQIYNYLRPAPGMYIFTIYSTFKDAINGLVREIKRIRR